FGARFDQGRHTLTCREAFLDFTDSIFAGRNFVVQRPTEFSPEKRYSENLQKDRNQDPDLSPQNQRDRQDHEHWKRGQSQEKLTRITRLVHKNLTEFAGD